MPQHKATNRQYETSIQMNYPVQGWQHLLDLIDGYDEMACGEPYAFRGRRQRGGVHSAPPQPAGDQSVSADLQLVRQIVLQLMAILVALLRNQPHEGPQTPSYEPDIAAGDLEHCVVSPVTQGPMGYPGPSAEPMNLPDPPSPGPGVRPGSSIGSRIRRFFDPAIHKLSGLGQWFRDKLVAHQGDNRWGMSGTCGLVSALNVLKMAGQKFKHFTEDTVVGLARRMGLCGDSGGTTPGSREALLDSLGVPTRTTNTSLENIASEVEQNKGVIVSVDSNTLWGGTPTGKTDHAVTITGVVRNKQTNQIEGFTICDSGGGQKERFVSYDDMVRATGGSGSANVNITEQSLPARVA